MKTIFLKMNKNKISYNYNLNFYINIFYIYYKNNI